METAAQPEACNGFNLTRRATSHNVGLDHGVTKDVGPFN